MKAKITTHASVQKREGEINTSAKRQGEVIAREKCTRQALS